MKIGRAVLKTLDAPAGQAGIVFDITRQFVLFGLLLRYTATYLMTGGTGAGSIPADAIFRAIRQIRVVADGHTIQTVAGTTLRRISRFFYPTIFEFTNPGALAAASTNAVEATWLLPFHMPWSNYPEEFALPTREVANPQVVVDMAPAADVVRGEDGVVSLTVPKLELTQLNMLDAPSHDGYGLLALHTYSVDITGSNSQLPVELRNSLAGSEIRAILVEAENNGTGGTDYLDSDTLINSVRCVINGIDVVQKTAWNLLRNVNKVEHNLPARESGCVCIDSASDQKTAKGELFTVADGPTPFVELDVNAPTGSARVRVTVLAAFRA